jgi:hypothetical protein
VPLSVFQVTRLGFVQGLGGGTPAFRRRNRARCEWNAGVLAGWLGGVPPPAAQWPFDEYGIKLIAGNIAPADSSERGGATMLAVPSTKLDWNEEP